MRKLLTAWALCFSTFGFADPIEDVFTKIYDTGVWGGKGFSGSGSQIENARIYVSFLQDFLDQNGIHSVVDMGCGDWQFSQHIDWGNIQYFGYDVVKSIIDRNQQLYQTPTIQFFQANGVSDDLPEADLIVCKDVLQHLSNADIQVFLGQLYKYKHCLITNDVDPKTLTSKNRDIVCGETHTVDLTKPPFNLKGTKVLTYRSDCNIKQVLYIRN